MLDLRDLSKQELALLLEEMGEKPFRLGQLLRWLYRGRARGVSAMSDLSQDLRRRLSQRAGLTQMTPERVLLSKDGARKLIFPAGEGQAIESVLIPEEDHYTLCLSTQVGCRMACAFCRTGQMGFSRNLRPGEISGQILSALDLLGDESLPLTNLVFMGMGEPLDNLDNLLPALEHILSSEGLGFSQRRVTVSTAGLPGELERLGRATPASLAVSINAPDDELRDRLMPVNRRFNLDDLKAVLLNYPLKPTRRITLEYVLLAGINDHPAQARQLAMWCRGLRCKVNLIPFNSHSGAQWRAPENNTVLAFQEILASHNLTALVRRSRGRDVAAACGQLAGEAAGDGLSSL
ncbi:MAG: 23S rRNA (adenine(2503)-C(2))-methyltransferase RlmN [Desulfarculales bacterium]|jgi:23S rRNA (adenine2503-C2)-methyltransferase|nr:23S rRNA (adenine(2503)-C(2))-methyltransferase RlmN [Desulfarculales bacterium]